MLVTAELSLRQLTNRGGAAIDPDEARQIVDEACDLLHSALTNVLDVTRNLAELYSLNAALPLSGNTGKLDGNSDRV